MTVSVYVTGTHIASVQRGPQRDGLDLNRVVTLVHAVSTPVVDGLTSSVCGSLVTAIADMEWKDVWGSRCEECQRLTS
jgi:hypothetical protein